MSRPYEVPSYVVPPPPTTHVGAGVEATTRGRLFDPTEVAALLSFVGTLCGVFAGLMFGDVGAKASVGGLVGTSVGMAMMVRNRVLEKERAASLPASPAPPIAPSPPASPASPALVLPPPASKV